jgi:hypothetical protein
MDDNFLSYVQHLELIAFFSGYPFIYVLAFFVVRNKKINNIFKHKVVSLLPFSYALISTLFVGFQLKKLYPDYSLENMQQPYLVILGVLAILFWIPALAKNVVLSLIHGLVFFFFLAKDLFLHFSSLTSDDSIVNNDMKIYSLSLLLNLASFALIVLFSFLLPVTKKD